MELRDYQHDAVDASRLAMRNHRRVICTLPTGAGKTVIAGSVVASALEKGNTVCIIVHRIEILKQFYKALKAFGVDYINFVVSDATRRHLTEEGFQGLFEKKIKQINLCMVETFHRRFKHHYHDLPVDLFVMDEIHWGSYRKLCHEANKAYILGLTATPVASSDSHPLNTYFDHIVCPVSVADLISRGFLVKGRTYSITHDFKRLKIRMGEYTESSMFAEFKRPKLFKGVVDNYLKHAEGKRAICYNVNVEHSKIVCDEFNARGVPAVHVDGTTPAEERARLFRQYETGEAMVLCNIGVATTGYDNPATRCIIENRATTKLALHHQMLGRGARPIQNIFSTKKDFTIIDMGRNFLRHGLYGERVNWEALFHNPNLGTNPKDTRKLIECPKCGAIVKASVPQCAYCGNERTPPEVEKSIQEFMNTEEVREYKLSQLPPHLRGRRFGDMSHAELTQYAKVMGYKPSWVWVVQNKMGRR